MALALDWVSTQNRFRNQKQESSFSFSDLNGKPGYGIKEAKKQTNTVALIIL